MKKRSDVRKIFKYELSLIQNKPLQRFVIKALYELAPKEFWIKSASSTGQYHPMISLGRGGLIRHTKLTIWWAEKLFPMKLDFTNDDKSVVISALLLHDIAKFGPETRNTQRITTRNHGIVAGRQLTNFAEESGQLEQSMGLIVQLINGVVFHMGVWTDFEELKNSEEGFVQSSLTEFIHLCDYVSSCKVDRYFKQLKNEYSTI